MARTRSGGGQGFWLTVGEVVGALALIVAGLNLWESHQQHVEATRRAASEDQARAAFVAVGHADRDGRTVMITPVSSAQVITSERYLFPRVVLDSPQEISAAQPRIDVAWLAPGLSRALEAAHVKGPGHGRLPVVIETTYVEDGDTTVDASLYDVGYDWKPRLFGGEHIRLDGLALVRRRVSGDDRKVVDGAWGARAAKGGGVEE
jgi:hypothetical protein